MELVVPDEDKVIASRPQALPQIFLGLSERQAVDYVSEMYQTKEFADGVIKPTSRTTLVLVDRFIDFMRYKDDQRFK